MKQTKSSTQLAEELDRELTRKYNRSIIRRMMRKAMFTAWMNGLLSDNEYKKESLKAHMDEDYLYRWFVEHRPYRHISGLNVYSMLKLGIKKIDELDEMETDRNRIVERDLAEERELERERAIEHQYDSYLSSWGDQGSREVY